MLGGVFLNKVSIKIALAYVGVIVGAGLSSGQDILQYFLSFGKVGMIGIVFLGILNKFLESIYNS